MVTEKAGVGSWRALNQVTEGGVNISGWGTLDEEVRGII